MVTESVIELEALAAGMIQHEAFSYQKCEELLMQLAAVREAGANTNRQAIQVKRGGSYIVMGLFSHGNMSGITRKTHELPQLCRYLNMFGCFQLHGTHATWTSFTINVNQAAHGSIKMSSEEGHVCAVQTDKGLHREDRLRCTLQIDGFYMRLGNEVFHYVCRVLETRWFQIFGFPEYLKLDPESIEMLPVPAEYHEGISEVGLLCNGRSDVRAEKAFLDFSERELMPRASRASNSKQDEASETIFCRGI
eukprot:s1827_g6.t1